MKSWRKRQARPAAPRKLRVEPMEDRLVPATVVTDKPDYAPTETAVITGTGFQGGETIQLQVLRTDGVADYPNGNLPWRVIDGKVLLDAGGAEIDRLFSEADNVWYASDWDRLADGNIRTSWYVESQYLGATLLLTAGGLESGLYADWAFTDALKSPTQFKASAVPNNTNSIQLSWTDNSTEETYFLVQRSTGPTFPNNGTVTVATVPSTTTAGTGASYTLTDTGLSPGTTYYYRIRALTGDAKNPSSGPKSKWASAAATTNSASNRTPAVSVSLAEVTVNEGSMATMTGTYLDPDAGDNVTITAWGTTIVNDEVIITGPIGTVAKTGTNSGTWTWTFTPTDGPGQSQMVIIRAQDSATSPALSETNFDLLVNNVAPTVTAPGTQSASKGVSTSFNLGSFTDPGADSPWAVTVNWGDGTSNTTFTTTATGSLGTRPHSYANSGTHTVTVSVTDKDNFFGSATFQVSVGNVVPVVTAPSPQAAGEGAGVAFNLGSFTDTDGTDSPWQVTVSWGDGTANTTFTANAPGSLASQAHTYADSGTYPVTVTVTERNGTGASGSNTFQAVVANLNPTATLTTGNVTYGAAVTAGLVSPFDPSPADTAAGFHYAFGYATANTSPLTGATYAGSGTTASANFGALNAGTYYVFARVIDKDGGFTEYSQQVTVGKADALISVTGYTGAYDGAAHGASGTFTGVDAGGAALGASLDLGAGFTNVPGGTAHWVFSGGQNYNDQQGDVAIVINKADANVVVSGFTGGTYDGAAHEQTVTVTGVGGVQLYAASLTGTDAGGYSLPWSFSGDPNYNPVGGTLAFSVGKANATVSVVGFDGVYDGNPHGVVGSSATGVNNEALTGLVIDTTTYTNVPGGLVHWTFSNANYHDQSGDAAVAISPAGSAVTVVVGNATYDGAAHGGTATVTGVGGLSLGLTVYYVGVNGTSYASSTAAPTDAGDYRASASFAGDANHTGSSGSADFTIAKASSATVTFGDGPFTYDGTTHAGGSGLVTGAGGLSTAATSLTYTGDRVNAGTYYVTAHYAGDANHLPSDGDPVAVVIAKAASVTTVTIAGGPFTYTGAAQTPATVTVTGAGGLYLTPDAVYVNNVNAGTATAGYSYAGDANHEASSDSVTFVIGKADATVAVTPYGVTYDGSPHTATYTVTGVNGETGATVGAVDVSGTTHTNAGTYSDSWSFTGGANYNDIASTAITNTIARADATFAYTGYAGGTYDGGAHTRTVTVTGVGTDGVLYTESLTGTDAGGYSLPWSFSGNPNYNPVDGTLAFTIAKANATFVVTGYSVTYDGEVHAATGTASGVLNEDLSGLLDLSGTAHADAGSYTDGWSFAGNGNYNSASGTVNDYIARADATVSYTGYAGGTYDGGAHTRTVTVTGVGGVQLYAASLTGADAGSYSQAWSFSDPNYNPVGGTLSFAIAKANQTIFWATPAAVLTGTELSSTQLNATVAGVSGGSAPGTLSYTPAAGTGLAAGTHTLTVTAAETGNYNAVSATVTIAVYDPARISGVAFLDFNHDGEVDYGEEGVAGAVVVLMGTDVNGIPVPAGTKATTDGSGYYSFDNLLPGDYTVTFVSGGTLTTGTANHYDVSFGTGGAGVLTSATNNFALAPATGDALRRGQTATIGFWQNKNGQALIKKLNGSEASTALGNWLAGNFPNMFGSLAGKTNAQVAACYQKVFATKGEKTEAQFFAVALSMYATSSILSGGTCAAAYGFTVTADGARTASFNVGSCGAVVCQSNNTTATLMDILLVLDAQASCAGPSSTTSTGALFVGTQAMRSMATSLLTAINEWGDIR